MISEVELQRVQEEDNGGGLSEVNATMRKSINGKRQAGSLRGGLPLETSLQTHHPTPTLKNGLTTSLEEGGMALCRATEEEAEESTGKMPPQRKTPCSFVTLPLLCLRFIIRLCIDASTK
ncbi:unnamed protein product [Pleuronectes platessa]|uniref:Uncharacterized protein n=1 Tax=Pleuronectes platessa TaxID=8262 RepID=A0A9N7U0J4_PLEPL|nr:unnamed protein product [Pleuronectes platessa]